MMKPMLASNWDEDKVRFPLIAQPKIDGVRALNIDGKLFARSLKPFKNRYTTQLFSHPALAGLDGEMVVGDPTSPSVCRDTTSALGSYEGQPNISWYLFDIFTPEALKLTYEKRMDLLGKRWVQIDQEHPQFKGKIFLVIGFVVKNMSELDLLDTHFLDNGYEGTILRDPRGWHKQGRSTAREGGLLRIKRFIESEAVITRVEEGQTNNNEAKINELGRTSRSTHQENMVPNGQVGNIFGRLLKDVEWRGKVILRKDEEIKVAAGCLTQAERKYYLAHQGEMIGKIMKFQFFPQGQKDKPRFPTFQSFRMKEDM